MNIILLFDKGILADMRNDMMKTTKLNAIGILDFCYIASNKLKRQLEANTSHFGPVDDKFLSTVLCQIFDSVDVDCRGYIDWYDFITYCLRSGSNRFRANSAQSNLEYIQKLNFSPVLPIQRLCFIPAIQLLFAFDGEAPTVRIYSKSGEYAANFNPIQAIARALKIKAQGQQPYSAKKVTAKNKTIKLRDATPQTTRGNILAVAFIDRKRHVVFSSSDCYLSFWTAGVTHMVGYALADLPQVGMCYSVEADVLITWPGDTLDHSYRIWDTNLRKLKYKLTMNSAQILSTIEVLKHGFMISASLDRKVMLWPVQRLVKTDISDLKKPCLLTGHYHAIRSLSYAPQNDLILGAGFDFDVYAWDPYTQNLQMKLVGHRQSIVGVDIVYNPLERAVTVDELGSIKIWNLDRNQGSKAEVVQAVMFQNEAPSRVTHFTSAFKNGGTIAVLAGTLNMFTISSTSLDDCRPVHGGLLVSAQNNVVLCVTRHLITVVDANMRIVKRLAILEESRISTNETVQLLTALSKDVPENEHYNSKRISLQDDASACTAGRQGKKLFVGTTSGRVFMFESGAFGLLSQPSCEHPLRRDHGAVIALVYCERDEVVVAAYSGGAVKVLNGCHRTMQDALRGTAVSTTEKFRDEKLLLDKSPFFKGGKPPSKPLLLRANYGVHESSTLALAVSEMLGLIAVSGMDGTVRILDYYSMQLRSVLVAPYIARQSVECNHLCFVPHAPILLGADSRGRITAWAVYPLTPAWILSWSIAHSIEFPQSSRLASSSAEGEDDESKVGIAITCLRCVAWHSNENDTSGGVEWSVLVGDDLGRVAIFDITNMLVKMNCHTGISKHSLGVPYQVSVLRSLRDGLEEYQIRELSEMIKNPIGANSGKSSYKGVNFKCITGRAKWLAHVSGVVDIACVQFGGADTNLEVLAEPQSVVTVSEYGIIRSWSWAGVAMGQATEELTEQVAVADKNPAYISERLDGILKLVNPMIHFRRKVSLNNRRTVNSNITLNPLFQRLRQETLHGVAVTLPTTSTAISQDTAKSRDSISRESAVITRTNSTDSTILSRPHTAGSVVESVHLEDVREHVLEQKKRKEAIQQVWDCKSRFPYLQVETDRLRQKAQMHRTNQVDLDREIRKSEESNAAIKGIRLEKKQQAQAHVEDPFGDISDPVLRKREFNNALLRTLSYEATQPDCHPPQQKPDILLLSEPNSRKNSVSTNSDVRLALSNARGRDVSLFDMDYGSSSLEFEQLADMMDASKLRPVVASSSAPPLRKQTTMKNVHKTLEKYERITRSLDTRQSTMRPTITTKPRTQSVSSGSITQHQEKADISISGSAKIEKDLAVGPGRYGPYKAKDVFALEDFISKFPTLKTGGLLHNMGNELLSMFDLIDGNACFALDDILNHPDVAKNIPLYRTFNSLRSQQGAVSRFAIIDVMFPYASEAERTRMFTLLMARHALLTALKSMIPPKNAAVENSLTEFAMSPHSTHRSLFREASRSSFHPQQSQFTSSSSKLDTIASPTTPKNRAAGASMSIKTALDGWRLCRDVADDLKKVFDLLNDTPTGTVSGYEIIDIVQSMPQFHGPDKVVHPLGTVATRRGFNANQEITGNILMQFLEECLKIQLVDERQFTDDIQLKFGGRARRVSVIMRQYSSNVYS